MALKPKRSQKPSMPLPSVNVTETYLDRCKCASTPKMQCDATQPAIERMRGDMIVADPQHLGGLGVSTTAVRVPPNQAIQGVEMGNIHRAVLGKGDVG